MPKKYIETGKIVGTHGVRGEMRVHPWCDGPEFITGFQKLYLDKNGNEALKIRHSRAHGNICLISADGIDTVESAEALRGRTVYIDREDCKLAEGQYFIDDIIGCRVVDGEAGKEYGVVSDVSKTGANDVWHIAHGGKEYLIPNIPQFVKKVDVENRLIIIIPVKGIFDDED